MVQLSTVTNAVQNGKPATMVTAYDAAMARLVDQSDVDLILVGDSVGPSMLGYNRTDRVTMADQLHHAAAVTRVTESTPVIVDLPFGAANVSPETAVENANRLKKEAGVDAVKIEGGAERVSAIEAITDAGIPVVGHLGVTPQTTGLQDLSRRGITADDADRLLANARAVADAGAAALVLELVAPDTGSAITEAVDAVTIGIAAGPACDAQVVTLHDLLGLCELLPESVDDIRADLGNQIVDHLDQFDNAVASGEFPKSEDRDR